jgi:hypothetical protein
MLRGVNSGFPTMALTLALALHCGMAGATDRAELYSAVSVTSGTGEVNRARSLATTLADVLVKVSGDPSLAADPRVAEAAAHAGSLIADFQYRDLLDNRPPNHEQGTYDRPQYLTATFEPAKIDALLKSLGREPWLAPRPRVIVFLDIETMKKEKFTLAEDGGGGTKADMRSSLAGAAERAGLPVSLPGKAADADLEAPVTAASLGEAAKVNGGDVALRGTMTWREEALGWVADWTLGFHGKVYHWQDKGVGYDDAFRNAMRGTAQILSGHGRPG